MLADRRSLLTGLAALPMAGLPIATLAAAPQVDPFTAFHGDILALHAAIGADPSEDEAERLMDRWEKIDREAMAGQPTTLAGALGALRMARREYVQFQMMDDEETDDPSKNLVLHLLDGAIAVLHQASGGGVA